MTNKPRESTAALVRAVIVAFIRQCRAGMGKKRKPVIEEPTPVHVPEGGATSWEWLYKESLGLAVTLRRLWVESLISTYERGITTAIQVDYSLYEKSFVVFLFDHTPRNSTTSDHFKKVRVPYELGRIIAADIEASKRIRATSPLR